MKEMFLLFIIKTILASFPERRSVSRLQTYGVLVKINSVVTYVNMGQDNQLFFF